MAEFKVGYIDIYKSGQNDFIGGLLIVDRLGIPVEFRHTETVSPTRVQKVLHGQALAKTLKCDTIARCLLEDVENKPEMLIVPDTEYYPLSSKFKFPFVQLDKANREPMKQHGDFVEVSEMETHLQLLSMRQPIRVRVDRKNAPTLAAVKTALTEIGRTMDVIEPMTRVQEALKVLMQEMK